MSKEGHLDVTFEDGSQFSVLSAQRVWQVTGPAGEMVICMPGGELSIWDAWPS